MRDRKGPYCMLAWLSNVGMRLREHREGIGERDCSTCSMYRIVQMRHTREYRELIGI